MPESLKQPARTPQVTPLTNVDKDRIFSEVLDSFASQAMRTIGLAYRDFPSPPNWEDELSSDDAEKLTGQRAKSGSQRAASHFRLPERL